KGKIVAIINPEERLALIAGNQLEIEKAELQLEKENKDSENYHQLKQSLIQLNENLEYAKNMYQTVPVICPMNGLVTQRWSDQGGQVSAREKIITITDMGSLVVKAEVNEKYFEAIKSGNKLPVILNAYPEDTLAGRITLVYPQVDPVTRSIKFDIEILNSNKTLLPGMMAFLKIPVSVRENVISIPEHAVLTSPDNKYFLFVVDNNSIVNRRVIETGIISGNKLEIKKGITENEKVIVAGQEMLKDSMKVKIMGSSGGERK
ncbi:MAG: efflux RND transporter periplasmic adaptor subunit, partial [Bacteroidales bacterium]|nr:efflux RND transporter periplasmic adaptor subunit [Bacteroidales bacterium]